MSFLKPLETIFHLLAARSRGDLAAALACYEPNATVVMEPGKLARGEAAIQAFTEATIALPITFPEREIIQVDNVALHLSQWTICRSDGSEISALTIDVLRRQPDGQLAGRYRQPLGKLTA